ncbi:uncharacterized protein LOC112905845 [Agrilus planipennis]|uniref:Uncharacterized protein LOC108743696 n=1 Tax=Agrilus planipennis TaxID=224129 RepID=A0A1W4XQL3_AGRPL|nr:uncharacterized protein LOC108743696 [Agrilus planipennis]XP_025834822.1 uncharacterized protein LOC112905845 [Agrilus planipennis]
MDTIDLLEKRIAQLELSILPKDIEEDVRKKHLVTDLLIQTHTMIATALSCREVVTSILQRMPEINDYLDPHYSENLLDTEQKKQYILELYPELKKTAELVVQFQKVNPFAELVDIDKLEDRLELATISNADIYKESQEVTHNILKSMQQYNDIISTIKVLFMQLECSVSEIEKSLQSKPVYD